MKKPEKKKKKNWFKRSTRIVGMDPVSFEEWWRVKINRIQLISISLIFIIILFLFNYLIFSYTPIGYLLPENIKNRNKQKIEFTATRVANLEKRLIAQDNYISNLQKVILGEVSIDSIYVTNLNEKTQGNANLVVDTTISNAEKQLDQNIRENQEKLKGTNDQLFDHLFLYDPVAGQVSQKFRIPNHPGVDIVTKKDEQIKACLNGVVLHSSYDDQDGHTIILSHENEIISVYKHAQKVYVNVGDKVTRGKAIGVVGNTGERSTGPHLHFELWSDMGPLDPLDYFSFGK
ncbi:M23 family metallopeptidase [Brumimicrobium glaciale]|jgi:murein DD-endopeptidase MepM/ murein hydrolase activator NlpD|uniref:M23 family metallopeptidase n=1 Tax=Brumimicrobium glaciale TaxID=200475 RepID=A0A4Q4KI24_9FLAO|nr:M23 family metallopeptidase [Brumimicrobium glaciale]RYM32943.1 M23 family metallopeptidase [Brumimicrobium glaciale]